MAASLGPKISRALPMFHSLTGCDTVSSFARHGKKAAWSTWKSLPELTDAHTHTFLTFPESKRLNLLTLCLLGPCGLFFFFEIYF